MSPEIVVLVNLLRKDGRKANVVLRGVEGTAFLLRPELRVVEGRTFRPGTNEAIVARSAERRFAGLGVGSRIRSADRRVDRRRRLRRGESPFGSEVWVDLHNLQEQAQREGVLSVVRLRAADLERQERLIASIRGNRQIKLAAKTEEVYFAEQRGTAKPIEFLAWLVGVIMAIGASFGAMNTMYAQVSARTREVATMRTAGFSRSSVLLGFVAESVVLSLAGGLLGAAAASAVVRTVWTGPTGTRTLDAFRCCFTSSHADAAGGIAAWPSEWSAGSCRPCGPPGCPSRAPCARPEGHCGRRRAGLKSVNHELLATRVAGRERTPKRRGVLFSSPPCCGICPARCGGADVPEAPELRPV